jgi:beta-lactamase superfamily II metal-dependent hydrolase
LRFSARLLVALLAAGALGAGPALQSAPLRIRQIDVGQGDAALITTPEGRRVLIDAGPSFDAVARVLSSERVDTLDLVIASHNHADHIGGMAGVFGAVVVRAYVENGIPHTTATYRRTLDAIERERGLTYLKATERTITVGSVRVRVLGPGVADTGQNNNSVGVVIEHGAFRALYTGDSEQRALAGWIRRGAVSPVTVVKAAHHGSTNGVTDAWVRATKPKVVLISVGAANTYGHPHSRAVDSWKRSAAAVYRTDMNGDIEILAHADGTCTVLTSRGSAKPMRP